ncbi:MAG: BREX-2 system phosphatase PglZ [Gemmatimonadetes bacterium]|nr:BREX-2 system phosphatase PglZ [Gemmatimonadota bacterium]
MAPRGTSRRGGGGTEPDPAGGVVRRAGRLGRAIRTWLSHGGSSAAIDEAQRRFVDHEAIRGRDRAERATMAARLVRALGALQRAEVSGGDTFADDVIRHVRSGSWFDAARVALMAGDTDGELSTAYAALLQRARAVREVENQRFAERLVAWNAHPVAEPAMLPVERVIENVVAPIADNRAVFVLLMDGMDLVVWRQLHAELAGRGWTWWRPDAAPAAPVAVAMLPSVTAFSRTSLFAGEPMSGAQPHERQHFAAHHALARSAIAGRRPLLFHKSDLGGSEGLAAEVRAAIGDRQQRVVGAVINAIDDWLDRSDQVTPRWSVTAIPLLEALLQEAAAAERAVVVLSDHGHLLDHDTSSPRSGESARWRSLAAGGASDGEVVASGARVRAATGQESVVLAVRESLRYTGKKTGYHGGATPQEVVAPIAVLSRDELGVAGWRPVLDSAPPWWSNASSHTAGVPVSQTGRDAGQRQTTTAMQDGELTPPVRVETTARGEAVAPPWIGLLLASPLFAMQRELAGRVAPRDEQMRALLETLERHNGRASRPAVASALALSELRVRGVFAGARRVLNVEGFAVLEEEASTGTLTLNRELLRVQFGLGG